MAKRVTGQIKLQIPAGQANPAPPVGPALGQQGVNIMEFCKAFNAATQNQAGMIVPVVISVYQDKSFTFVMKSPPVGPALGQHGVNIMEFCKAFNAKTQNLENGMPTPVVITVYADRSFTFITKTPPAAVLLRKAAGVPKGSGEPNTKKVGKVNRQQLEEIAKLKEPDLTAADLDAAVRTIAGTARSMGLNVEGVV